MITDKPMTAGMFYVHSLDGKVDPSVEHYHIALTDYVRRLEEEIRALRDRLFTMGKEIRALKRLDETPLSDTQGGADGAS